MLCIKYRRRNWREKYERLPLLPKYVVRVRQYGNNVSLTVEGVDKKFDRITWERDGEVLEPNSRKIHINQDLPHLVSLVIFDVAAKDSATYQCILKSGRDVETSDITVLDFSPIKLIGPAYQRRTGMTRKEIRAKMKHQPILPPNCRNRSSVKYDVIITSTKTTEYRNECLFAQTTETDMRRSLHYGVLLSKNSRLRWRTLNGPSVLNDIYQRFHNTAIRPKTSRDCRKKCATISSLKCTERHVTFASSDVEYATLWNFLQTGCVTSKMAALMECRNLSIVKRYFRSDKYVPDVDERCVCLPAIYRKQLQERLLEWEKCNCKSKSPC